MVNVLLRLVLVMILSTGGASAAALTGSIWDVDGVDTAGNSWNGSTLVFTDQTAVGADFDLSGYFDWVSDSGHSGRELFNGKLFADRTISLQGYELQNSNGTVLATYGGVLSEDGNLISGDWPSGIPGGFTAVRRGRLPAAVWLLAPGIAAVAALKRRRPAA